MDILTHTLSGMAAAGVIAGLSSKPLAKKAVMIGFGALGAMLPDIDAITLWSKFDDVIGARLGLPASGARIYFGHFWYSHHHWAHSLAAGALFTLLIGLICHLGDGMTIKAPLTTSPLKSKSGYLLSFFLGYVMHLMGDLPTPGYVWQGIQLWWPLSSPVGGTGHLWWWNNYDIFIIFFTCCTATSGVLLFQSILKKPFLRYFPILLFIITMGATLYQITHRPMRFTYAGRSSPHALYERQSLAIQKDVLGERLYSIMAGIDRQLKINF